MLHKNTRKESAHRKSAAAKYTQRGCSSNAKYVINAREVRPVQYRVNSNSMCSVCKAITIRGRSKSTASSSGFGHPQIGCDVRREMGQTQDDQVRFAFEIGCRDVTSRSHEVSGKLLEARSKLLQLRRINSKSLSPRVACGQRKTSLLRRKVQYGVTPLL